APISPDPAWYALTDPSGISWGTALYPPFWIRTQRFQAASIFHELTHRYAWTHDKAGYINGGVIGDFTNLPTYDGIKDPQNSVLIGNADTYTGFLLENFLDFVPDVVVPT